MKMRAADLLFPRRCPVCDRPVLPRGGLICRACADSFVPVEEPVCLRCGKPVPEGAALCRDCRIRPHWYERGCSVFVYRSISASLYRFNYEGRREYADYYAERMAGRLESVLSQQGAGAFPVPDALVPVPVSARRLRTRGYNQAALLAERLSEKCGIPVLADVLRRDTDTAAMRLLGAAQRYNNLKRTFHAYGNGVHLKSIMLIDDIYTTGATVNACAEELLRAGAERVTFMTLAIGEDTNAE